jgi:D-3-phosphoglycerate dehydrogenase
MYRIWFERPCPTAYAHMLSGIAVPIGSSHDANGDPFASFTEADAAIAGSRLKYSAHVLSRARNLRVISRTGAGVDNIDLEAATQRGIAVCHTPEAPVTSTAEHTLALILAVAKQLKNAQRALEEGRATDFFSESRAKELAGKRLGLVGLGRIGSRVARLASCLGLHVHGFDPQVSKNQAAELGVELAPSLEVLLGSCEIVSLHVPLTRETRHLINRDTLRLMRPGSILINCARGGLVDEVALLQALESGHIQGAGLDVFAEEPPLPDHPLLGRPDVVATPHIASATDAGRDRLWRTAIEQALQVLRGERPPHLVNPSVCSSPHSG